MYDLLVVKVTFFYNKNILRKCFFVNLGIFIT